MCRPITRLYFMVRRFIRIRRSTTLRFPPEQSLLRARSLLASVLQWAPPGVAAGAGAAAGGVATLTSTGTTISTAAPTSTTLAAIGSEIPTQGIQATNGNTTRNTAGAPHIRTVQRQTSSAVPRVAIHWLTARRGGDNRSAGKAAISAVRTVAGEGAG